MTSFVGHWLELSKCKFGSFVVQVSIDKSHPKRLKGIVDELKNDIESLSCNIYGSHVVETLVTCYDPQTKKRITKQLYALDTQTHKSNKYGGRVLSAISRGARNWNMSWYLIFASDDQFFSHQMNKQHFMGLSYFLFTDFLVHNPQQYNWGQLKADCGYYLY